MLSLDLEDEYLGWVDIQLQDVLYPIWWRLLKYDYHIQDVAHANPPSSFQSPFLGRHNAINLTTEVCFLGLVDCFQYNLAIKTVLVVVNEFLQELVAPSQERVAMFLIHIAFYIKEEVHGI
jgi:hypothetical protein